MYYQNIMSSNTSSTINVKGSRKVVIAKYYTPQSVFGIPDGLDLEDDEVVEEWEVKYNTLLIKYIGKEEVEVIEPSWVLCDNELDYPEDYNIEDADGYGYDYPDDEEKKKENDKAQPGTSL